MTVTMTRMSFFDHNDECIGCREHFAHPHAGDYPVDNDQITVPVVLRAAAGVLMQHPMGIGHDVRGAVFGAAQDEDAPPSTAFRALSATACCTVGARWVPSRALSVIVTRTTV